MGEDNKKISFGFSKLIKKTQIVSSKINQPKIEKSNIELIDCFEGKAIKLKNHVEPEDKILIIPLQRNQEKQIISNKQGNSNNFTTIPPFLENSTTSTNVNVEIHSSDPDIGLYKKTADIIPSESNLITTPLTLDEIAAKEILQDLKSKKDQDECKIFTVPLTTNAPSGENESTLDDYESIPVGDFGLAMLRGMGWCPGKGIGKNEKLVTPSLPTLRPKGMGLGADKVLQSSDKPKTNTGNDELKMVKGSFVRVLAGQHKSLYGQIEGFDDETGRLIVKLSLKNESVSLNEFMVQVVDKQEFLKNSKVINVSKYEQYKDENKEKSVTSAENDSKRTFVSKKSVEDLPKHLKGQHKVITKSFEKKDHIRREADKGGHDKFSTESIKHQTKLDSRSRSSSSDSAFKGKKLTSETKLEIQKSSTKESKSRKKTKHSSSRRSCSSSSSKSSDDSFRQNKKISKSTYKHHDSVIRSSHKKKYFSDKQRRSSSSSSSSSASSDYKKKRDSRTYKKKSSSKKSKDRGRSRSPRKHSLKTHRSKHRDRS